MFFSHDFWKPATERRGFQNDLLAILLFFLITILFFARFLTGDLIIAFKDLSRYFYPLRWLMVAQVKAGHLPLWNPYIFCGFPLLATLQVCFFYPLTAIYYLLPFNLAFNWYIILHYFLAACFMYAMLKHFKLGWSASFFGGFIFAFSGYLLSVSNMNTSLSSVIWLPLLVMVWDRIVRADGSQRLNVAASAVLLALMFLGGEPTIFYVTFWFLFFYTLVFAQNKLKSCARLFGAALLSLGLIAIQLIPFLELARLSDRVVRTGFEVVSFRSFPPRELMNFIFPYFFGNPAQFGGFTETLLGKTYQDWLITPYLGVLPLILTLFAGRNKLTIFLWSAAGAALLLAFGGYSPFYRLIYFTVPGFSLIRYPVKYLFLVTFCLTFLSALGFERLVSEQGEKRLLRIFAPLTLPLSIFSLFCFFFSNNIISSISKTYPANIPPVFFEILAGIIKFNLLSIYNLTFYLLAFCLLLAAVYWQRLSRPVFAAALILLSGADLLASGAPIMVPAPAQVFSFVPPNYAFLLKDKGLNRFFYTPEIADANRVIAGENYAVALFNAKDNLAADWPVPYQLFDFAGYESIEPYKFSQFYRQAFRSGRLKKNYKYLRLFNVKYVVAGEPLPLAGLKLLRHKYSYGRNVYLYEDAKVLPRAYLLNAGNEPDFKIGQVTFEDYRPGFMRLNVSAARPARLFLSEANYPGWRAFVDSRRTKILVANDFFQAIDLPAGRHEVKFVYEPLSLKIGAGISLLTCVLLAAFCFLISKNGVDDRTFPLHY